MDKLQKINFIYGDKEYNITGDSEDYIFKKIQLRKTFFELELLKKIAEYKKSGVYIDIGANIGNHTLFFANSCPSEKVFSFECFPTTYQILEQNVKNNCNDNKIIPINSAIGNTVGNIYLTTGKINNSGTNHTTDEETNIESKLDTLDCLFSGVVDISVIKIDVEGDELKVINGGIKVIEENHPLIIVEISPKNKGHLAEVHQRNLNEILDTLSLNIQYNVVWHNKKHGSLYILEPNKEIIIRNDNFEISGEIEGVD